MNFKDHFSGRAGEYRRFRPEYPGELYAFLFRRVGRFENAWDAATGNGQVAVILASRFTRVYANDASERQLENARKVSNIRYLLCRAESTPIPERCIDFVSVAQALHWLDHGPFYREVRRVCRDGSLIAAWAYGLLSVEERIDSIIGWFNSRIVGPFWPPERAYVDAGYETIPFPFEKIASTRFSMEKDWTLEELLGYISTWSSAQRFAAQRKSDPLRVIRAGLEEAWGDPRLVKRVRWPVNLLLGRV